MEFDSEEGSSGIDVRAFPNQSQYKVIDPKSDLWLDWNKIKAIFEEGKWGDVILRDLNEKINCFMWAMSDVCWVDAISSSTSNMVIFKHKNHPTVNTHKPFLAQKNFSTFVSGWLIEVRVRTDDSLSEEYMELMKKCLKARGERNSAEKRTAEEVQEDGPREPIRKPSGRKRQKTGPTLGEEMIAWPREDIETIPEYVTINLPKLWLNHPCRRFIYHQVFNPNLAENDNMTFNRFSGFAITAEDARKVVADTSGTPKYNKGLRRMFTILEHISTVWCGNPKGMATVNILDVFKNRDWDYCESKLYWILCWLAHSVQKPWEIPRVSPFLIGPQGIGKSIIFTQVMAKIIGDYFKQTSNVGDAAGNFTASVEDLTFLFLDEANTANRAEFDASIKALITEPNLRIRKMRTDTYLARNHLHIAFASNFVESVPSEERVRRFMGFQCENSDMSSEYFRKLVKAIDGEENLGLYFFANLLYDKVDIQKWVDSGMKPISTSFMDSIMINALPPEAKFLDACLQLNSHCLLKFMSDKDDIQISDLRANDPIWMEMVQNDDKLVQYEETMMRETEWVNVVQVQDLMLAFKAQQKMTKDPDCEHFKKMIMTYLPLTKIVSYRVSMEHRGTYDPPAATVATRDYFLLGPLDLCKIQLCSKLNIDPVRYFKDEADWRRLTRVEWNSRRLISTV